MSIVDMDLNYLKKKAMYMSCVDTVSTQRSVWNLPSRNTMSLKKNDELSGRNRQTSTADCKTLSLC